MSKRKSDAIETEPIPATTIDGHLWAAVIQYLDYDDLQNLRLAGSKNLVFYNPLFTSHLALLMDRVPFFGTEKRSPRNIMKWLYNRNYLVINGRSKNVNPFRVACLVKHGLMNSVTEIAIRGCSSYRLTISELAKLPNLKHVRLLDEYPFPSDLARRGKFYDRIVQETSQIVESLKGMTKLETLDLEFDCVVPGKYLSAFQDLKNLTSLSLRGFDLCEGIEHISGFTELEELHLCHGNTCTVSENAIPQDAFRPLESLTKLQTIHLENINGMTQLQVKPLCRFQDVTSLTFKHCQELSSDVLSSISTMYSLQKLHFINSPTDEYEPLESENLLELSNLKQCSTLSLIYILLDMFDILDLEGMVALETLNIGLEDFNKKEFDILCLAILPSLPNLKYVRIFVPDTDTLKCLIRECFKDQPEHMDADTLIVGNWNIEFKVFGIGVNADSLD